MTCFTPAIEYCMRAQNGKEGNTFPQDVFSYRGRVFGGGGGGSRAAQYPALAVSEHTFEIVFVALHEIETIFN